MKGVVSKEEDEGMGERGSVSLDNLKKKMAEFGRERLGLVPQPQKPPPSLDGSRASASRVLRRFSTAVAIEEPITPPVQVQHTQLLINERFVDAASGKTFPTLDPRTGDVITHVAEGDVEDVNCAVAAARKAFDEGPWPGMTGYERSHVLLRFADLIE